MLRILALTLPLLVAACSGGSEEDDACALAEDHAACPECSSGPATCTFEDTSITQNSCGDCQARSALYQQLCDDGSDASRDTIEADTVCESDATDACALAEELSSCDACYDGEVTCTYGAQSATEASCGECQARGALYQQLCDDGLQDPRATIEADTVCE